MEAAATTSGAARLAEMRVVVVGPGALGCLIAASIAVKSKFTAEEKSPPELWLLDHRRERADFLGRNGLILEEGGKRFHCTVRITSDPAETGAADIVFLCVKSQDVQQGLTHVTPLLTADSILIALQNGIGHLGYLEARRNGFTAVGVTAQGAHLVGPGQVRHAGEGLTRIGFMGSRPQGGEKKLETAAALLTEADISTAVVNNILDYVWAKLLVNVGINALTAINNCANGELLDSVAIRGQMADAVREAERVARAKGINLDEDPVATAYKVCKATSGNISSMLQDVRKMRATEIDSINGAIVKEARHLGIPVPVNEMLVQAVKKIERGYEIMSDGSGNKVP